MFVMIPDVDHLLGRGPRRTQRRPEVPGVGFADIQLLGAQRKTEMAAEFEAEDVRVAVGQYAKRVIAAQTLQTLLYCFEQLDFVSRREEDLECFARESRGKRLVVACPGQRYSHRLDSQ